MKSSDRRICGLVLHFRTPERTLACLRSLLAEGVSCVVIVDNSEDAGRSLGLMRDGLADLRLHGLEIKLVEPGTNLGFAAGVREGLLHIGHGVVEGVLLINSDARLVAGSLQLMLQELETVGVVAPHAKVDEGARAVSPVVFYHRLAALYLRKPCRYTVAYPSGACLLLRNDALCPDLFDPDFFFYGEDVELGHDLTWRGVRFVACEGAFVLHAGSASAGNGSMFYEYHINRAHWLLARKLAVNGGERVLFVVARCITLPLRALVRSLRFRSMVPWKGLVAATFDVISGRCRTVTPPAEQ